MSKKYIYHISSPKNITFRHVVAEITPDDFGYSEEDWEALTPGEREDMLYDRGFLDDIVWGEVDIWAEEVEETDD